MKRINSVTFVIFFMACSVFLISKFYYEKQDDREAPILTLPSQPLECSVHSDFEKLLVGAEAYDEVDGNLTSEIFVESLSSFVAENTRILTAAVVDSSGNVSKATRTIIYNDYESPRFTMSQPLYFYGGEENITQYIMAFDEKEGNISSSVKVTSKYRLKAEEGEYPIEFVVSNSMGDAVYFTATVSLYSVMTVLNAPSMSIDLTNYLVYADEKHQIDPYAYIKSISINSRVYENNIASINTGEKFNGADTGDTTLFNNQDSLDSYGTNQSLAGFSSSVFNNKTDDVNEVSETEVINPEEVKLTTSEEYGPSDSMPAEISMADIQVSSNVDYSTPGSYEILYRYSYNDYTKSVRLVVIVE